MNDAERGGWPDGGAHHRATGTTSKHAVDSVTTFDALCANEPELAKLRTAIREFLRADRHDFGWQPTVDSWLASWDEGFSARLGDAGFLGLTIPVQYSGQGVGHLHRYVVTEELLAQGAPVAAHWIADRQVAPALLAFGDEEQRNRLLPRIAAGRFFSAIGMSEHGAGSDLAAVQTKGVPCRGGWRLTGTKTWTSGAHRAHQIVVLARTTPLDPQHRHAGFSQFLVPCDAAGMTISPIELMSGEHHFNEVILDDVFVPDADVLGEIGNGWHQVTAELSFERSGPERILSTAPLIAAAIRALASHSDSDDRTSAAVGDLMAQLISLRQLSISVARELADGGDAAQRAALVKDIGTRFEQDTIDAIADLLAYAPPDRQVRAMMVSGRLHKPLFTLRGGTNEVLRGVVARGMGLR
jgi:acyl-CoA dehydrogenase